MHKADKMNLEVGEEMENTPRMFLGTDVVNLFGSMGKELVSKSVKDAWMESGIKLEDSDWKQIGKYVALCCTEREISR